MFPIGQKAGPKMFRFTERLIERRNLNGLTSLRRDPKQDIPVGKDDRAVCVPGTAGIQSDIGDRHDAAAQHVDAVQPAGRKKRNLLTVRRPEQAARALGSH